MKVALLSLDVSLTTKARLGQIKELVLSASSMGASLCVLPEMSFGGYNATPKECDQGADEFFAALAKEANVAIAYGHVKKADKKLKNSVTVVSSSGEELAHYDKMHVFTFANEQKSFEGGDVLANFSIGDIRFGLSICYDLRFAELYSLYAKSCDAVLCIAAWPKKRISTFKLLLKARAVENVTTLVGVNWQGGEYVKSSYVATQNGVFSKPVYAGSELDIYEISPSKKDGKSPNSVDDKRFELYAKLYAKEAKC